MPWTPHTPYVLQSYPLGLDGPDELFHATEAEQIEAFNKDKKSGIYNRVWRGKGESEDRNTWETIEEWPED